MNQIDINPALDLFEEIEKLKRKTDTVILAHYYQNEDIQDIADFIGDSLDLAKKAQKTSQKQILFAGVHFMAETAKILNSRKTVLIPDINAGCSLADGCQPEPFSRFVENYPDHIVLSYINCSAEIKALSDIIVTSSNVVKIVQSIPPDQKIVFAPDQFLGKWVMKQTARNMVLWKGSCIVHETFSQKELLKLKLRHPKAKVVAHPECPESILNMADFVGSTKKILNFVSSDSAYTYIVVTEPGIIYQMKKNDPEKEFIPALTDDETCSCNECPYMKLNTLEKIYLGIKNTQPEILMDEKLRSGAETPLLEMLARS